MCFMALPVLWYILSFWRLAGISQRYPSLLCISVWLSHLGVFCLTIDQFSFYYQPMRATYIHSIWKGYPTSSTKVHLGEPVSLSGFLQSVGEAHRWDQSSGKPSLYGWWCSYRWDTLLDNLPQSVYSSPSWDHKGNKGMISAVKAELYTVIGSGRWEGQIC